MTKKQHKAIAEMWAAGSLLQAGYDSFDKAINQYDQEGILREVDKIANKLLKGRIQKFTLPEIIKEVTNG